MRRTFALLVAVALLVAACGDDEDDAAPATTAAPETTAAAAPETTAAPTTTAAPEPVQLTVLAEDIPSGLDYDGPSAAIPTSQTGMVNLQEYLVYYKSAGANSEGVGLLDFGFSDEHFEGRLAESWSFDEASLTWTFNLREGVVGCNGATFNADDVLYTFARAKSVSGAAPIGWFLSNVGSIDGFTVDVFSGDPAAQELGDTITKVDDYTVNIRQAAPNKLFLPILTIFGLGIFDKETMEANATDEDPWSHDYANNVNLPSFGPYCLENWEKDSQFVVVANPDYYRGAPSIDRIVYRKVPETSNRLAAILSGDAQLVERLTPREFDSLAGNADVTVAGVQGNDNLFVHMNYSTPPFDNLAVRKAVAHAINYDEIIRVGYFGNATKWEGQIPSSYPGYYRSDTQYDYDPDRARELLAEAGYADDGSILLSYVAEKEAILGPIATLIQADLAAVGVNVQLDPLPQTQYGDRQLVKKDLQFALNDQEKPIGVDAGYATLLFFVSTEAGGLNNMVNFASPEVDGLFGQLVNEADETARNALLAEVQDILADQVTWLPVVERTTQWAFSSNVSGLVWHPDNSVRWYDLSVG